MNNNRKLWIAKISNRQWILMDVSHSLNAMGTEVCYDGWVAENTWKMKESQLSCVTQRYLAMGK